MEDDKMSIRDLVKRANELRVQRGEKPTTPGAMHNRLRNRGIPRWRNTLRREYFVNRADAETILQEIRDGFYQVD